MEFVKTKVVHVISVLKKKTKQARDPAQHRLLLGESLGTQRRKIHSAVTTVPRLFTFIFLAPPYPRRILTEVLFQTDRIYTLNSF